jgi:hypothetical protein
LLEQAKLQTSGITAVLARKRDNSLKDKAIAFAPRHVAHGLYQNVGRALLLIPSGARRERLLEIRRHARD